MKRAIFSDVHSNLEALTAVLRDIETQHVDDIFSLGDVVGYGPNPLECIDLVSKNCRVALLGNHDQGALFDPDGFNGSAERAIFWTRDQLEKPNPRRDQRWDFLNERPRKYEEDGVTYVHGSPKNPLNEYIFPEDTYNPRKLDAQFNLIERFSFQGHTHVPGVFTDSFKFYSPEEFGTEKELPENGKLLINVGSVGQPRDGNPQACYVILEDNVLCYRRVTYDFDQTIIKINAVTELDRFLGERLREGR